MCCWGNKTVFYCVLFICFRKTEFFKWLAWLLVAIEKLIPRNLPLMVLLLWCQYLLVSECSLFHHCWLLPIYFIFYFYFAFWGRDGWGRISCPAVPPLSGLQLKKCYSDKYLIILRWNLLPLQLLGFVCLVFCVRVFVGFFFLCLIFFVVVVIL